MTLAFVAYIDVDDPPWTREHLPRVQAIQRQLIREAAVRTRPRVNHRPVATLEYWNRHHSDPEHPNE